MANIDGTFGDDDLFGTPFNDTVNGFGGNDYLDGLGGADLMDGGDGHDLYIVDNVGDVAAEAFDDELGGVDRVQSSVTHSMGFGIEYLTLTGATAINGTGNENDNDITGNDANNVLSGLGGKDWLKSEGGNDQLFGGSGNDALYGGDGKDLLNGGTGADYMWGGDHNDTYIVDNVGDKADEHWFGSGGVDLVKSSVSYTLGPASEGIENLTLTGAGAINGTGNGLNNVITGNGAKNVLSGLAGNDQLTGGSGKDTLTGGTGNDTFVYKSASDSPAGTARDVITDFKGNGASIGDQISLTAIDANTSVAGNQAFIFGGPHTAGHLWYAGGILNGNIDGDATVEFQIQLTGGPALVVSDILL